jgi:predicted RNA-binding Zn ribbon-like protein
MTTAARTARRTALLLAPRADLCLDYANTLAWRGSAPEESLKSAADLFGWCVGSGVTPERIARRLRARGDAHPPRAAKLLSDALALREAIYRIFHCVGAESAPADADLMLLNDALARAPKRTRVGRSGREFGWRVDGLGPDAASLLAPVLWSAADLLVGTNRARVRYCANDRCRWLFLDQSKNRTRRWCSMQSCGNRAKAHRHYLRRKRN